MKVRRAASRWLGSAPECVIDIFDNKKTADRYTIFFEQTEDDSQVLYLGVGDTPNLPNGYSQWGCLLTHQFSSFRYRSNRHRIRWLDLPEEIREHVVKRATEIDL